MIKNDFIAAMSSLFVNPTLYILKPKSGPAKKKEVRT
jgi:hypothetical protein